jgi:ribosomal protein L14
MRKITGIAVLLALLVATSVAAQQVYTGSVLRIDPSAGVIVFSDGRMLQTTADTVIISGNQRMMLSSLQQGTAVTVYQAQPVALRDGRYVLISETGARAATGGPVTAIVPPPPPPGVVVAAPPSTVVVTQPPAATMTVAPTFEVSGTVLRADPINRVLTLNDGRKIHLTQDTQVLINGTQPTPLSTLKPGTFVVVRSVTPFAGSSVGWVPMKEVARGIVVRMDQPGVIVLSDGRAIQTTANTVVLIDNRPVAVTTVQPGARVVIFQDGTTMAVVNEPAASPALSPEAGIREMENDRQSQ